MTDELTKVIRQPTIKYELHRVVGGRAPKTEVTLKVGGDIEEMKEDLANHKLASLLASLREVFISELKDLQEDLKSVPIAED